MVSLPLPGDLDRPVRVEVRLLGLPTRRVLGTSHDRAPSSERQLVVIGIETTDGVIGWGECSALNEPTYTHEWAADSFDRLARWAEGGLQPDPARFPMAAAAIEMASLDATLRADGRSLADALGTAGRTVTAGAAIGLGDVASIGREADRLVADGFRRLKFKIEPSRLAEVAHAVGHLVGPDGSPVVELQVDANGSLGDDHLMQLLDLTLRGVTAIEQPFPVDRPDLAAEVMLATDAVVIADEAASTLEAVDALVAHQAVGAVAIKPPRLGGIRAAIEVLDWCRHHGLGASIGGMLECGLGRHSLAALAGSDGFSVTGDLSPAGQWLADDPWPDLEMTDGRIVVPTTAGVAPPPDPATLDRLTLRRVEAGPSSANGAPPRR